MLSQNSAESLCWQNGLRRKSIVEKKWCLEEHFWREKTYNYSSIIDYNLHLSTQNINNYKICNQLYSVTNPFIFH